MFGCARNDGGASKPLHVVGAASGLHKLFTQRLHRFARDLSIRRRDEHAFGVARGEALAAPGTARLEQHRRALRRRFREVIAIDVVVTPRMSNAEPMP